MRIRKCEILEMEIPFKESFKHSLKERSESDSILVRLESESGETGWGESLPREYVTGETREMVVQTIREKLLPVITGHTYTTWEEVLDVASQMEQEARVRFPDLPDRIGASRCALELAFLDLAGRHFRRSVSEIFGQRKREWVNYSGVIGSVTGWPLIKSTLKMRLGGLCAIKIKVGGPDDRDRVKRIRQVAGSRIDLRVDANGAWHVSEAIGTIQALRQFDITCVEQPVKPNDLEGLQAITTAVTTPIMVDESLCTMNDAKKLVAIDACDYFNIRLSKCGGIFASLQLAEFARNHDKGCQLGCQVGETAILSAAGRHFALGIAGLRYVEGSYGTHLLQQDIARQNLTFRRGGIGRPISGPGLGIDIIESLVEPHVRQRHTCGDLG